MAVTDWRDEWNDPNYAWPTTPIPDTAAIEQIGRGAITGGGRVIKEAHADRGVTMSFPNGAALGTRIRKQVPRTECRRRAQIALPDISAAPLKVCVVCDAVHLWPKVAAEIKT